MKVYISVRNIEGHWYGIGYTFDHATQQETRVYTSYAYQKKQDAQADVFEWHRRWLAQGRVK